MILLSLRPTGVHFSTTDLLLRSEGGPVSLSTPSMQTSRTWQHSRPDDHVVAGANDQG
jgi:hypothetical protein